MSHNRGIQFLAVLLLIILSFILLMIYTHPHVSAAPAEGVTELVSVSSTGEQGNFNSYGRSSLSADGRFVAFRSHATNLVIGDINEHGDIFVHDRQTGATERVSVSSSGEQGDADSYIPSISADGRFVAFDSHATNLVSGDTNVESDIFVHDRQTGATERVSVSSSGEQGDDDSSGPSISADGRFVAFSSRATNLVSGDTNGVSDLFIHDRQTGETERLSVSSSGDQGDDNSGLYLSISADGRIVTFWSIASNLVSGDTNGVGDIFVHDRQTGETERVSVSSSGEQGNNDSHTPAISADGRFVAFESFAINLVIDDTNSKPDIFVHDRQTGATERVSVSSSGEQVIATSSHNPSISANGRFVAFNSYGYKIVCDTYGNEDIFVHDRQTGETVLVSESSTGEQGNDFSQEPSISADGSFISYYSYASNLVSEDTNGNADIFVSDRYQDGSCNPSIQDPILVVDENGSPISEAQVFRNGSLAGLTDSDGLLDIPGLAIGDQLVARQLISEEPAVKGNHSQDSTKDWAYRVYHTSLDIPVDGKPEPYMVNDLGITQTLRIKSSNPLLGFNILASIEWDANSEYLDQLRQGFELASAYLYDASNGQMLFERVTIYDNNLFFSEADDQIWARNVSRPNSIPNGITTINGHTILGRYWDGGSSNSGFWNELNGFTTLIHEFGHYGLFLYDSYNDENNNYGQGECTSADILTNKQFEQNATIMYRSEFASEFAMQDVPGLWSEKCKHTYQFDQHPGKSDWETILEIKYPGLGLTAPTSSTGVISGPTVIPVAAWIKTTNGNPNQISTTYLGTENQIGICEPAPVYYVLDPLGRTVGGADVVLRKPDRSIYEGHTDVDGKIVVLGAAEGDRLVIHYNSGLRLFINDSFVITCGDIQQLAQTVDETDIVLHPAAYGLSATVLPAEQPNEIHITVNATTQLNSDPIVYLTQQGKETQEILLSFDESQQTYIANVTLDANHPASGILDVIAYDFKSNEVEIFSEFKIENVSSTEDALIYFGNGLVDLTIPAGALAEDSSVTFQPAQLTSGIPENLRLISGPYRIDPQEIILNGNVVLTLHYLDFGGSLNHVNKDTAQIYRWDGVEWSVLPSSNSPDLQGVSAYINSFGTYAAMAEQEEKVYLPMMNK